MARLWRAHRVGIMGAVLSSANAASTPTITAESGKTGSVKAQSPMEGAISNKDIKTGTSAFRRVTLALTAAGFSTFAVLYCVQPLLPVFTAVPRQPGREQPGAVAV